MSFRQQISDVIEYYLLRATVKTYRATCRDRVSQGLGKARIQKILWRAKPHEALDAEPSKNFILKHEAWVAPEYVLKDNVSLFGISEDGLETSFVEVKNGENVYTSQHGPFLYITQFNLAVYIITMSTDTFLRMSSTVQAPSTRLIFASNTGRCGSTLLAQMFENVPGIRVLSEPHSILTLLMLYNRKKISEEQYKELLHAFVKILVTFQDKSIHTVVIKPVFKCTPQISLLQEMFPESKVIFLYRNIKETVDSFMRVMVSFQRYASLFTNESEIRGYWVQDLPLPLPLTSYRWARDPTLLASFHLSTAIAFNWCCTIACVKTYIQEGLEVLHMDYKDLVKNPLDSWSKIAQFVNLTSDHEGAPLAAYNKDSQAGAFLSRGVLSTAKPKVKDMAHIEAETQKLLTAFNLLRTVTEELNSVKGVADVEND